MKKKRKERTTWSRAKSIPCFEREPRGAEYYIWVQIKQRCYNPKDADWDNYGGRGISVCHRWLASFEDFLMDMGRRPLPELTIERANNDGNYEPDNCYWATRSQQSKNQRRWLNRSCK